MRRTVLTVIGVLLIATLTSQTTTAAARYARKFARAAVPVTMAFVLRSGRVLKFKGRRTSYSFVTSIEARYDLATA